MVQWVARMSRNWLVAGSKTIKVVSFSKKHYPHCSLVQYWLFECHFTIELNYIKGLTETYFLNCQ